jgi:hypothetical protein
MNSFEFETLPPDPGTRAASDQGCTCPVVDNCHGRGFRGERGVFLFSAGCPVHDPDNQFSKEGRYALRPERR